jgi:gliding motility-associated-like protein
MVRVAVLLLLLAIISGIAQNVWATHILGGEIAYRHLGTSGEEERYKVILSFLGDCRSDKLQSDIWGSLHVAYPSVNIYDGGDLILVKILEYDALESDMEITPVCPDEVMNTTCSQPTNPIPGIKKYVYSTEVTLPRRSSAWSFRFIGNMGNSSAARSTVIQNADVLGGASLMYLEATLNNIRGANNSTYFTSLPIPFFCVDKEQSYNLGAVDPDQDRLVFSMIPAQVRSGNNDIIAINYFPPYSAEFPIPAGRQEFNFDTRNGQMSFMPNQVLNCVVVNRVEEYREGILVGSNMRETTFIIMGCYNTEPGQEVTGISNAVLLEESGNPVITACAGQRSVVSFDIASEDQDGDNVTISFNSIPPGARFDTIDNGTKTPRAYFEWDASGMPPGDYIFYVSFTDDGCPISAKKTQAYIIRLVSYDGEFVTGSGAPCRNDSNGKLWIAPVGNPDQYYRYTWTDQVGNILRDIQQARQDTLPGIPQGSYAVTVTASDGCTKVYELPLTGVAMPPVVSLPADIPAEKDRSYSWNTGATDCCIMTAEPGNYVLKVSNPCGVAEDEINIDVIDCPSCLFIPNAFSPNGDGRNDVFRILETCVVEKFEIKIFNRWGTLVYSGRSTAQGWDGTYNGVPADGGVYYYLINIVPKSESRDAVLLSGDIILVR